MDDKKLKDLTQEEAIERLKQVDRLFESLKRIMTHSEPSEWPTANWFYQELARALHNVDIWEQN